MLRVLVVLLFLGAPAHAWEASVDGVCQLFHDGDAGTVRVTYDPAIPEYAIAISPERAWSGGPIFAMRFDGPRGLTISTDRHAVTDGGATLTVTDSGFGNVLNGLEFNETATALLGEQAIAFSLDGAAPAVRAFRACASGLNV